MTEIYKIKNNHSPSIKYHLFQFRENTLNSKASKKKTSNYRLETASYRASFLWHKLLSEYKNSKPLVDF